MILAAGRGVLHRALRSETGRGAGGDALRAAVHARAETALKTLAPGDVAAHARLVTALPGSPAALEAAARLLGGADPVAGEALLLACARADDAATAPEAWRRLAAWYRDRGWSRSAAMAEAASAEEALEGLRREGIDLDAGLVGDEGAHGRRGETALCEQGLRGVQDRLADSGRGGAGGASRRAGGRFAVCFVVVHDPASPGRGMPSSIN